MNNPLGGSVFNREEFATGREMSRNAYNVLMGACLLWGFAINALTCTFFGDQVTEWAMEGYNYWILIIGYIVLAIVGIIINTKSDNPAISFIGYNMVVVPLGLMLCPLLTAYSVLSIQYAFIVTALVTAIMIVLSGIFPNFFAGLGKTLFVALLGAIIAEIVCMFLFPGVLGIFDWIVAIIFCGYIGYDWYRSQHIPSTADNAVDSACALYLDIINLFIRILEIIGDSK